ncbi:MAG: extracellular solute-binding protein [Clostridia bacterium]|nr:extracellular solute-binding protein [Clostridia bacterium]
MKKLLAGLLIAALLLVPIAGCGETNPDSPTVTGADPSVGSDPSAGETAAPETEEEVPFEAEVYDLGGRDIVIYMAGNWAFDDFEAEEMTGEALNDARYQTNTTVADMYNINLKTDNHGGDASGGQGTGYKAITSVNMAGTSDYAFASIGCYDVSTLAYQGHILDLNKVKNIDLDKPWWDPKANEQLSVKGRMFYTTGDIGVLDNDCTYCILFNKQVVENFGLESPYELVRENRWTYDKFIDMADTCDADLNGDGKYTNDDAYGILIWQDSVIGMLHASGGRCATINDDGTIELTLNTEQNIDVVTTWLTDRTKSFSYFLEAGTDDISHATFIGNRCLFYTRYLRAVSWFRDLEADFGILPYPKWKAEQKDFCNTMHAYGTSYVCIPIVAENVDQIGSVIEALAYFGRQYITPAYYDVTLKGKYFRDEESADMLDLIFETRFFDVGMYYQLGGYNERLITMMQQADTDFASAYVRNEKMANKILSKINDAFAEMGN